MTPFELKLQHEFEEEFVRMANGWFFKWYNINITNNMVDVEDFFGGRFHTGGIVFQGQIQQLYWQSVEKYLKDKVHSTFVLWDKETSGYPSDLRRSSLEGTVGYLRQFVARIIAHGTETDRRLRGQGFPEKIAPYNSTGHHSAANVEIERLKASHLALLGKPAGSRTRRQRFETFFSDNKGILTAIGITTGVVGLILTALKIFVGL